MDTRLSHYKLVRDRIPEVIRSGTLSKDNNDQCEQVLDLNTYRQFLLKKIDEEVAELKQAIASESQDAIENELADVHEVLVAVSNTYRCRDVVDLASEKASQLGGFYQGFILSLKK